METVYKQHKSAACYSKNLLLKLTPEAADAKGAFDQPQNLKRISQIIGWIPNIVLATIMPDARLS